MVYNSNSDNTLRWLVLAGELIVMNMALATMYYLYWQDTQMVPPHYKRLMVLMSLTYIACESRGHIRIHSRFVRADQLFKNLLQNLTTFICISLFVLWVFRWPLITFHFMAPFYLCCVLAIAIYRWVGRQLIKWYRSRGRNSMSVVFVGNLNIVERMYTQMRDDRTCGYLVMGYFANEPNARIEGKYLGKPQEVTAYLMKNGKKLHNLYCMLPSSDNDIINEIMHTCEGNLIRYNHVPDSFNYQRHHMSMSLMAGTPVMSLHNEPLAMPGNRIIKRVFDLVVSSLFLFFIFPIVYIVFGFLIKRSSPGPILFRQKRSGLNGKDFYCLKFRSMKINADSDNVQATKDDPRKTTIGEFMRKTSIDELPQFINVFMGDMSVVGPRPHMVKHTSEYSRLIGNYMVRHLAKPGITGWAQVTGSRGETQELWQMEERVKKDIWYIERWSLSLDIYIILKTILNSICGEEKAY